MANQLEIFKALDEEMVRLFEEATPEGLEKAYQNAKTLLDYAELPLGLRIRACIILAGFDEPGYLDWAKEAVRVAELAWDQKTEHTEVEHQLRQKAYDCLEQSQKYFDEHGDGGQEEQDDEEEEEEEHEDVKLVSSREKTVNPDGTVTTIVHKAPLPDAPVAEEEPEKKKAGKIRVDTRTKTAQQQDPETGEWVTMDVEVEIV